MQQTRHVVWQETAGYRTRLTGGGRLGFAESFEVNTLRLDDQQLQDSSNYSIYF